ncbi:hypothetical protein [Nocardia sp. NPDC058705]|uniref:hypothetical protein n=1 Tax=Nocardia sp. NPDC058705 TaxID=3346609 RepID=UPI0036BD32D5
MVLPEHDMGERVAHLVTGHMIDYIEFDADYAMAGTTAPKSAIGKSLTASGTVTKSGECAFGLRWVGSVRHLYG